MIEQIQFAKLFGMAHIEPLLQEMLLGGINAYNYNVDNFLLKLLIELLLPTLVVLKHLNGVPIEAIKKHSKKQQFGDRYQKHNIENYRSYLKLFFFILTAFNSCNFVTQQY